MFARRMQRDTGQSRKCAYPFFVRGLSNVAQHLGDGTVLVRRGQRSSYRHPRARDCHSPWLASPLFKKCPIVRHHAGPVWDGKQPKAGNGERMETKRKQPPAGRPKKGLRVREVSIFSPFSGNFVSVSPVRGCFSFGFPFLPFPAIFLCHTGPA